MSDDFPAFALSEEHEALREAKSDRAMAGERVADLTFFSGQDYRRD